MTATIIRPTQILEPDADTLGRYVGAVLQYRGTTLADLYDARIHLEAAAVEMLARNRTVLALTDMLMSVSELHNQSCPHFADATSRDGARAAPARPR